MPQANIAIKYCYKLFWMKKEKLIDKMKEFFDNTTAEEFIEKWNEIECDDENGMTVEEYLKIVKEKNNL